MDNDLIYEFIEELRQVSQTAIYNNSELDRLDQMQYILGKINYQIEIEKQKLINQ